MAPGKKTKRDRMLCGDCGARVRTSNADDDIVFCFPLEVVL